jgi:hypothetical protein
VPFVWLESGRLNERGWARAQEYESSAKLFAEAAELYNPSVTGLTEAEIDAGEKLAQEGLQRARQRAKERASREKHNRRERHQAAGRARTEKAWEQQRAAARAQQEAEE